MIARKSSNLRWKFYKKRLQLTITYKRREPVKKNDGSGLVKWRFVKFFVRSLCHLITHFWSGVHGGSIPKYRSSLFFKHLILFICVSKLLSGLYTSHQQISTLVILGSGIAQVLHSYPIPEKLLFWLKNSFEPS